MTRRTRGIATRLLLLLGVPLLAYLVWSPGVDTTNGRFNRAHNGVWASRGWIANPVWFDGKGRRADQFSEVELAKLSARLQTHGVSYVYPHLCPAAANGHLPEYDAARLEALIAALPGTAVLPWIGGVLGDGCRPGDEDWRRAFCAEVRRLQERHTHIAGVHLNIEPLPDGHPGYLLLLEDLKSVLGKDRILSLAAYPPPTRWHPYPEVHWSESYYREVCRRADQIVPMMYDTSVRLEKVYVHLMETWTHEILDWSEGAEVVLGVPAYEEAGVWYHNPRVERLGNALAGINAALEARAKRAAKLPAGLSLYADWTTSEEEWQQFRHQFGGREP